MKKLFSHSNKKAQDWEELEEREYDWDGAEEGYAGADSYADEEEPEGQWPEESEADGAYYEDEEYAEAPGRRGRSYGYEAWEPEGGEGYGAEEDSWEPAGSGEYYAAEEDEEAFADGYGREGSGESFGGFGIEDGYEESHDYYGADELEESDDYYETDSRRRDDYYAEDFRESDDYYGTEGGMEEDVDYYGQEEEGSAGYYRREEAPYASRPVRSGDGKPRKAQKNQPEGFLAAVGRFLRGMDAMDRITVAAGLGVLVLVILTVSVFVKASITDRQVSDFADVGKQLDGITTIGEKGLMAVADAELAKLTASAITPDDGEEEPKPGYEESGYDRQVSVQPSFTSIQKDLKIKFVNKKTDKLVANVPFSVTVTGPDGKSAIWSDDDMDGIIYKKDIAAGTYKVAMESLSDERYASYAISTQQQSVEVKKEISYSKVDVSNEVKQESEVNAKQEDTKKNDVVVESSLQDTVPWVESKVLSASYEEVGKNIIPDPMTLAMGKGLLRMSEAGSEATDSSESSSIGMAPSDSVTPDSSAPTDPSAEDPSPTPSPSPSPEPLAKVSVTVTPTALTGRVGTKFAAKATAVGTEGKAIEYIISSDNATVATATIDAKGDVSVQGKAVGKAKLTITANYKEGGKPETAGTTVIEVTIKDKLALSLDKTSLTVYTTQTADITIVNYADFLQQAGTQATVTATSSDVTKATVSVSGKTVTVAGQAEGTVNITVNCQEGTETVSATCAVTVKKHPKEDKTTLLKDKDGRQIYVAENNTYREAVRSDYYTAAKFYVKTDVKYTGWQTINGKVYYFTADGNKVTGEQVIQGAKYNFASDGSLVVGNGTMGIDVSKWNGNIDWNAVKNSGVSYVIIRSGYRGSSEGKLIVDPKFESNIKGATSVGLKVGIYFFSQAVDEIEAVEEASMVLGQIKDYKISYPVFLDVEASGGRGDKIDLATRTAVCKAFCQTIQNAGYTAGVYSNKTWLEGKLDASSLSSYKIWLAQYAAAPTYKGRYDLWQYRSTGSVSGVSGNVDMNISYLGY